MSSKVPASSAAANVLQGKWSTDADIERRVSRFAETLIRSSAEGIRWKDLYSRCSAAFPWASANTVAASLHAFRCRLPAGILNPSRGLYRAMGTGGDSDPDKESGATGDGVHADALHAAFASWLCDGLQEVTHAAAIGAGECRDPWGTPDVIALRRANRQDILRFPDEVICAEIGMDTRNPGVAFGQACTYRLFSHRVYLVVPDTMPHADLERLEALTHAVGIGLVVFGTDDPAMPDFRLRARAGRHAPDDFHVNLMIARHAASLGV